MAMLIDTSLWIDFTRARSTKVLKQFIAPYVLHTTTHLAEPIIFEVLRHATPPEAKQLNVLFDTLPILSTPTHIWSNAIKLGQACRERGTTITSLDLLIATIALHHEATVITFDSDFVRISETCDLRVKLLRRPH